MANTIIWDKNSYVSKLRTRISKPSCWTDVLKVIYTNDRTVNKAYASDEGAMATGTRETAYTYDTFNLTLDTLTISTYKVIPLLIDEADRYQQDYAGQMEIAAWQGKLVDEYIETAVLAAGTSGTDFGATDLTNTGDDDTTAITVSAANIDDIIRAIKRKIYSNNGVDFAVERGIYIVWRAEDFELLEAFVQANGFTEADIALKNGIPVEKAFKYMGVYHYLSNSHTANHVLAGIRGSMEIGILKGTYGRAKFIEDPGNISGLGIVTRVDYGTNLPAQLAEFTIDVNVN